MASCHSKCAVYERINCRTIVRVYLGTYIENVDILMYSRKIVFIILATPYKNMS